MVVKFRIRSVNVALRRFKPIKLPASVARQNSHGDSAARKNAVCASAVENGSNALRGDASALILSYTILTYTERGASAMENLGSPRF